MGRDYKNFRVHGLLTDLQQFEFWSYDPALNEFFCVDELWAALNTREGLLQGMMKGAPYYSVSNPSTSFVVYS